VPGMYNDNGPSGCPGSAMAGNGGFFADNIPPQKKSRLSIRNGKVEKVSVGVKSRDFCEAGKFSEQCRRRLCRLKSAKSTRAKKPTYIVIG
jgi:hypothetical protein